MERGCGVKELGRMVSTKTAEGRRGEAEGRRGGCSESAV